MNDKVTNTPAKIHATAQLPAKVPLFKTVGQTLFYVI